MALQSLKNMFSLTNTWTINLIMKCNKSQTKHLICHRQTSLNKTKVTHLLLLAIRVKIEAILLKIVIIDLL